MKILLKDRNIEVCNALTKAFNAVANVSVSAGDASKAPCDILVVPVNGFGFMDHGFAATCVELFGKQFENRFRNWLKSKPFHELQVGDTLAMPVIDPNDEQMKGKKFSASTVILVVTTRVPMRIVDPTDVYLCTRSVVLHVTPNNKVGTLVMTGLGTGLGGLDPNIAANTMMKGVLDARSFLAGTFESPVTEAEAIDQHFSTWPEGNPGEPTIDVIFPKIKFPTLPGLGGKNVVKLKPKIK